MAAARKLVLSILDYFAVDILLEVDRIRMTGLRGGLLGPELWTQEAGSRGRTMGPPMGFNVWRRFGRWARR